MLNYNIHTLCNITFIVSLGLICGAGASALAIVYSPIVAVIVMGCVTFMQVPYSAYKEIRIVKLPSEYFVLLLLMNLYNDVCGTLP